MDRCALFVDAGYLLADGAMAVHGTRHREAVSWDFGGLLQLLGNLARERTGLPLLRCYWYEATVEGRRSPEHDALADLPGLKLRLGRIRPGRREGVDAEIHRDLMTLARNGALADAVVVSGDEDLAQVVGDAQDLGVRVTVVHVAVDGNWTISRVLRQECDDLIEIGAGHLRPYVNLLTGVDGSRRLARSATATRQRARRQRPRRPARPPPDASHNGPPPSSPLTGPRRSSPSVLLGPAMTGGAARAAPDRPGEAPARPAARQRGRRPTAVRAAARRTARSGRPPYGNSGGGSSSAAPAGTSSRCSPPRPRPSSTQAPPAPSSAPPRRPRPRSRPTRARSTPPRPSSPRRRPRRRRYRPAQQQCGPYTGPQQAPPRPAQQQNAPTLAEAVKAAHQEGQDFGESVARDAPALWLEAVLARKPRMPSDLEARLLQGSSLPIDFLLHDEVRHALRRGFWDALERSRRLIAVPFPAGPPDRRAPDGSFGDDHEMTDSQEVRRVASRR